MGRDQQEIEQKLSFFQEKMSLTDVNIRIRNSSRTGIHFDESLNYYIINYNDRGIDYFLAHELGHILLSKKTNCPTFANPPLSNDVDETIFTILDYLINVLVNSLVCRTNELYEIYALFFNYYVKLNFRFKNATELVAFNISATLEDLFNLKLQNKDLTHMMSIARYYDELKKQSDFNQKKYDMILLKLNDYKDVITKFDLQKILSFLFEITCLICDNFNYMNISNLRNQFRIFFGDSFANF